jgi:DNA transposition AAA+ family ATPase
MAFHPTDPELREALDAHRTAHGLTNHAMGKLFGVSATFISKYLNDKLDHPPGNFDAKARDTLKAINGKLDLESTLFETSVSRAIAGRIDMARRTSDVCLIHGVAGEGKTSGGKLYCVANPSTLYLKVVGRAREADDMQSMVFELLSPADNDYSKPRWDIIVGILKGSQRALIVDNAHRLSRSGRDFFFDLNEETGVAIIFLGNPEILKWIKGNDQQHSRIGVAGEATYETKAARKELSQVALRVAAQFSSEEFADEISDLVAYVANRSGRLRAVRKAAILAHELHLKNGSAARESFRTAHSSLVHDYVLPGD